MITRESLLEHGYKPFQQRNIKEFTTSLYQKLFSDETGKRFYLTLAEYDNSRWQQQGHNMPDFSYSPDAQFTDYNGTAFNVDLLSPNSVESMEEFFESVWRNLGCDYYEEWSEA